MSSRKKILIVEDENIIAEEIRMNVKQFGYVALGAVNTAEKALITARQEKPDLVIMDIVLSGKMEGTQAAEIMYKEMNIPVIFLTAHADRQTIQKAVTSEPYGYIMKPYEVSELKAVMEIALYKHEQDKIRHHSTEMYSRLTADLGDIIFKISIPDRKIEFINPACKKLTGYDQKAFYDTPDLLCKLLHPDMKKYYEEEWQKIVSGKAPPYYEYKIIDSSGNPRWFHQTNVITWGDKGQPVALQGIITDITQCYNTLVDTRKKEEDLRNIVSSIKEGILIVDDSGILSFINQAAIAMLKLPEQDAVGRNLSEFSHLQRFVEICDSRSETSATTSSEFTLGKGKERRKYITLTHIPMSENGQFRGFIAILHDITEKRSDKIKLRMSYLKSRKLYHDTVKGLIAAIEIRDPYTAQHQRRVAKLAEAIALEMNLPEQQIEKLYTASQLHDIGKLNVPSDILAKGRKLLKAELDLIKLHPQTGYEILNTIAFPEPIADIVLQHHELMNGSGYPRGLKKGEILPEARILCVADVTEAMINHRPYRPQMDIKSALEEIDRNKGILYDADTVDACLKLFQEKGFSF
ncbi:MAG: HD domain-containing protein [Candidatus Cloacimonetes bacterium]|nr:HD domain-containing protein [Candidatus Cloacimonadota bacterium]